MKKHLFLVLGLSVQFSYSQIINTVAGTGYCCSPMDGVAATSSSVYYPNGVFVDAAGNMYIAEPNKIRLVGASGIINTFAGTFGGYSGDGGPATSAQLQAYDVVKDAAGNIYAADQFHNVIRKINTSGIISTIAGNGSGGFSGDGGQAVNAVLNGPCGLAFDAAGNLYFADTRNDRVRKISPTGIITTVAGSGMSGGGFAGDGGPATSALLNEPMGISVDAGGIIYIADYLNHRVRKVSSGTITTVAGNGTSGFGGDGGSATSAQLKDPSDVTIDGLGNLYIADQGNSRVRVVNTSGIINTFAGDGTFGDSGDGGPATAAQIGQPWGVAVDIYGNLFIADVNFSRIRKVSSGAGINETGKLTLQVDVFPNPASGIINIKVDSQEELKLEAYDVNGRVVLNKEISSGSIDISNFNEGVYLLNIRTKTSSANKKMVVIK